MTAIPPGWTPEQARERLEKATPGPWEWAESADHPDLDFGVVLDAFHEPVPSTKANAAFIAHAPTDIAALLALLGEAREALANLHAEVEMGESVGICLGDRVPSLRAGRLLARLPAPEDAT